MKEIIDGPVRIERIFKASDHQFSAASFHKKCDNVEDTLTLIQTEFGKVIGGYTHKAWASAYEAEDVIDKDRQAFLFSLDLKEKFTPTTDSTIAHSSSHGPIFGGFKSCNLGLADKCNI